MSDEIAGLIAEIVARPTDDGVREVLADLLQARGDPRGELISLQLLASRGNHDRDARIRELLERHAKSWLGWLREAATGCRFDRGFASRLELGDRWAMGDPRWDDAKQDPALATVEELVPGGVRGHVYAKFLTSPTMVNLHAVEVFDRKSLEGLIESTAPIRHVSAAGFITDEHYVDVAEEGQVDERRAAWRRSRGLDAHRDYRAEREGEAVPEEFQPDTDYDYFERLWALLEQRPSITSLAISERYVPSVVPQQWFAGIRALTIGASGGTVRRHLASWNELGRRRLTVVPSAQLEPCGRDYPWDYKIEVIPDGDGAIATVSGEWLILPPYVLDALPSEVTRIDVIQSSDERARRIRDVVTRPGVDVVFVPLRANNFAWEIR